MIMLAIKFNLQYRGWRDANLVHSTQSISSAYKIDARIFTLQGENLSLIDILVRVGTRVEM